VSTQEQADRGYGLPVQRERIRAFCRSEGWRLVDVYEDPGVPGTSALHERDGLSAALAAVGRSQHNATVPPITGVVVARFDRLARDTLQALLIERDFTKVGAGVWSADGMNGDQTMRELMHVLSSAERRALVARLAAGRKAKAAQGGYVGGRPRLGYSAAGGELVVNELEAKVVRGIFMHVAKDGWTVRRVASDLDGRHALGRRWDAARVHGVLRWEGYKLGHSPIVDARIWNRAQAVLASRRRGRERQAA
jgi:site-specific DNA recombinase